MRKTVLILLGVVLYLLLGAGGAIPADAVPRRIETVSGCSPELNRTIDRFACERICNSDLQLPAPARIAVPRVRDRVCGFEVSVRMALLHGAWQAAARGLGGCEAHILHLLPAGSRAADYYVYVLRRLLI